MNAVSHNGRLRYCKMSFQLLLCPGRRGGGGGGSGGGGLEAAVNLLSEKLIGDMDHMMSLTTHTLSDVISYISWDI